MFGYALRHPKLPASNGIINKAGLTPLTLACKLGNNRHILGECNLIRFANCAGRAEVFREMLELSAKEFWRYSNITCSAYTLNALDTLLPNGKTSRYLYYALYNVYLILILTKLLIIFPSHIQLWRILGCK